ncbi:MAG: ECF transporter S component [Clostridium sp.]|uniref:ECF transporter S component n=1 Tax=Clostridium TaxID=1485 RepID=UPI0021526728|nr:ECF transporter S component [Clostridium sp. LY3-2]MCR6515685.1 ECF transporter S component [Clostridium sp. LY3-2]
MEKSIKKQKFGIRQLVIIGMLSGISIFMGLTGLGFIPLPFMKATIMHVPVIIGAIIEGPIVGMMVGLVFGLFSMYQAATAPVLLSPFFLNPIVSLVPRILIGLVAYYIYKFFKNKFKNESISVGIAAVLGTLTNTVGVLGLIYILYLNQYANLMGISQNAAGGAIGTIALTNGIPESIVSALIAIPVVKAIQKLKK